MAFGIGINSQQADAGAVKGSQRKIACDCWFTATGKIIPRMLKIRDEDGEIRVIKQIVVHSQEAKNYCGIPSVEFDCTLPVLEHEIPARLIYYQTENRWVLNYQ